MLKITYNRLQKKHGPQTIRGVLHLRPQLTLRCISNISVMEVEQPPPRTRVFPPVGVEHVTDLGSVSRGDLKMLPKSLPIDPPVGRAIDLLAAGREAYSIARLTTIDYGDSVMLTLDYTIFQQSTHEPVVGARGLVLPTSHFLIRYEPRRGKTRMILDDAHKVLFVISPQNDSIWQVLYGRIETGQPRMESRNLQMQIGFEALDAVFDAASHCILMLWHKYDYGFLLVSYRGYSSTKVDQRKLSRYEFRRFDEDGYGDRLSDVANWILTTDAVSGEPRLVQVARPIRHCFWVFRIPVTDGGYFDEDARDSERPVNEFDFPNVFRDGGLPAVDLSVVLLRNNRALIVSPASDAHGRDTTVCYIDAPKQSRDGREFRSCHVTRLPGNVFGVTYDFVPTPVLLPANNELVLDDLDNRFFAIELRRLANLRWRDTTNLDFPKPDQDAAKALVTMRMLGLGGLGLLPNEVLQEIMQYI